MKLSIECECETKLKSPTDLSFTIGDSEYFFIIGENGFVSKMKIIAKVPNPEKFYSVIDTSVKPISFTINSDKEFYEKILDEFKHLESSMSFSYHIKKISWEEPKVTIIPENDEEKEKIQIYSRQFTSGFPDIEHDISLEELKSHIESLPKYKELTFVKSFYREGMNEYNSLRYINAFYNFYFILEGIYGNGKTRNKDIEKEFLKSDEFKTQMQRFIDTQILTSKEHLKSVKEMLDIHKKDLTVEGLTSLLVLTRGRLHHYVKKSSLPQTTPFNQKDYHSISFIAMGMALIAILLRLVEINNR